MKIELDAKELATAMARVAPVINRKVTNPLLTNVLITATKSGVKFTGTDEFMGGSTKVTSAKVIQEGAVAIEAARLHTLANGLPAKTVKLTEKANAVELRCGKSKYNLLMLEAEEFPPQPKVVKGARRIKVPPDQLLDCIRWSEHAMGQEETRAHLKGALLDLSAGGGCNLVTCDGSQLVKAHTQFDEDKPFTVFLPDRAVAVLKKMCETTDEDVVTIAQHKAHLFFWTPDVGYSAKLLQADPLPYDKIIPTTKPTVTARVNRRLMEQAVKRILAMEDVVVTMMIDSKKVRLTAANATAGSGIEDVKSTTKGKPLQVAFNARDFSDAVSAFDGDEIDLMLWAEDKPAVVVDLNDEQHRATALLMPMSQS